MSSDSITIKEVWEHNLEEEFVRIRAIVEDFPYIALDTEFPGFLLQRNQNVDSTTSDYMIVQNNVNLCRLIQLGLTFSDERGNLPTCETDSTKYCVWQFNFREFDPNLHCKVEKSIKLLKESGIDFQKNCEMGVHAEAFGELLMSSGAVLNDSVHWIVFQGAYDFGYLLKLLTNKNLPDSKEEFYELISMFFPVLHDVKYLIRFCQGLSGGLEKVAATLRVERIGTSHQAGSDSLLTCRTFFTLIRERFNGSPPEDSAGFVIGI
ncbi:hypothetical protein JCGZ_04013 [Jatropha curcas]|uniref:poly(A)-specific ribonuclease n=2 Tax=Jatropha curcas TaxID=180498 RepID=A0A067L2F4_JATCU|nr:hypothetical protein JCGZ_04013 [Jatropha curcas]